MQNLIIKNIVVPFLMNFINEMLTGENVKVVLDKLFDFVEEMVINSKTSYDDMTVLPIIARIRVMMDVPDLPDGDEVIPADRMRDPAGG